jgi:hypothetical protein
MQRTISITVLGVAMIAAVIAVAIQRGHDDRKAMTMLRSSDIEQRKRGAWFAADFDSRRGMTYVRTQIQEKHEDSPAVREAYVFALGQSGADPDFDTLLHVAQDDPSGYVRQAALTAAARLRPARLRSALSGMRFEDDWGEIGQARALLWTADSSKLKTLFDFARRGDHDQKVVSSHTLDRIIRPVLEAAGRWPIAFDPRPDTAWSNEWLDEIEKRAARLDLDATIRETWDQHQRARDVIRNQAKLNHSRDRVARMLFGG